MAITLMDIFIPSEAPCEIASIKFVCSFFTSSFTLPFVTDSSVSGKIIFEITKAAGAAIKLAARRYSAFAPIFT